MPTPDEVRAAMSKTILTQMSHSADPQTRENANIALRAQGIDPEAPPTAPVTAPAPAAAAAATAAPPAATPTPAPPAASPAPAPGPAPSTVPFDKDVHGLKKYNTLEELKNGYFNAVNKLSEVLDENARLKSQSAPVNPPPAMLPGSAPGDALRVNPTTRSIDIKKVVDELVKSSEESGQIDPTMLLDAVTNIADQVSRNAVQDVLRPRDAMAEAELYMRQKYPDSVNHGPEMGNFVKSDPIVADTMLSLMEAGKFKAAFEYAWTTYTVQKGISVERGMEANSQIAEEERVRARAAAGFSGSPNTGVHAEAKKADQPLTPEEVTALNKAAAFSEEGRVIRRRAMLGNWLPAEWRTWEAQGA